MLTEVIEEGEGRSPNIPIRKDISEFCLGTVFSRETLLFLVVRGVLSESNAIGYQMKIYNWK